MNTNLQKDFEICIIVPLQLRLSCLALFPWILGNLKTKSLVFISFRYFSLVKSLPFLWGKICLEDNIPNFDWRQLIGISEGSILMSIKMYPLLNMFPLSNMYLQLSNMYLYHNISKLYQNISIFPLE